MSLETSSQSTSAPAEAPAAAVSPAVAAPVATTPVAATPVAATPVATTPVAATPVAAKPAVPATRVQTEAACPVCGKPNALDSRFCRYCGVGLALVTVPIPGAAPKGAAANNSDNNGTGANAAPPNGAAANGASASAASAKVAAPAPPTAGETGPANPAASAGGEALDPEEIDARRARQLLDRALALSDKGDKAGAILACRQAIGLAPGIAAGYAMLGPLLERSGDPRGAMGAYERVLSLQPSSPIERDSLARLRAAAAQAGASRTADIFHFDAGELFNETETPVVRPAVMAPAVAPLTVETPTVAPPTPGPVISAAPVAAATVVAAAAANPAMPSVAPLLGSVSPAPARPAPTSAAPAAPSAPRVAPVAAPSPARSASQFSVPPISATPLSPVSGVPLSFPTAADDSPAVYPRWVRALRGENSFWMQSVPLSVIAVLSLGFLLWARNTAASRIEAPVSPVTAPAPPDETGGEAPRNPVNAQQTNNTQTSNTQNPANPTNPNAANPNVSPQAETITNGRVAPPAPAAPDNGQTLAAAPSTPRAPRSPSSGSRAKPELPPQTPEIAPFRGLRPPRVDAAVPPEPPVRGIPVTPGSPTGSGTGGITSGGVPLNPAGAGRSGTVRITMRPAGSSAPVRPEARSRAAETAAADAARAGQTSGAISSASASIDSGRDTGWRYQQRALLFLEQGDNNRAADDFRTAIAAYRDQMNRGVNAEQARSGISACQDGLRLAQLRLR